MADCVAKVFFAFGRETLIQDRARTSNNDSKEPTLRFDCYKFLFHRACLATFATQSAHEQTPALPRPSPLRPRSGDCALASRIGWCQGSGYHENLAAASLAQSNAGANVHSLPVVGGRVRARPASSVCSLLRTKPRACRALLN